MIFTSINWVLVLLIIIAGEILVGINRIKGHIDNLKVDKIEVKDLKHK